ncbi:UDP-glucose 4-epimerase GalE [Homoserinimonas sp. A447]
MRVLLTGGAGFIGSHVAIELATAGHTPIIVDNLVNASEEAVRRVRELTGSELPFHPVDLRDEAGLRAVFETEHPEAVIHLAGLKAVGDSVANPLEYYRVNLESTLTLATVMRDRGVRKIVFSSTATAYGTKVDPPFVESNPGGLDISHPYGKTKYMIEQILRDLSVADDRLEVSLLRYFNPIGAHPSGRIGEDPAQKPNNLAPFILQVAVGRRDRVQVFGNDYPTPDGTGLRDYIHVMDVAVGHVAALEHLSPGARLYNLGSGTATSVLELIAAYSRAVGREIPFEIVGRRPGDDPATFADASLAKRELDWSATRTIDDACVDSWNWQSSNPHGYEKR